LSQGPGVPLCARAPGVMFKVYYFMIMSLQSAVLCKVMLPSCPGWPRNFCAPAGWMLNIQAA